MTRDRTAAAEWRSFWYLPVAAALGYSTAVLHTYALGPFIEPLQQEFGWSRAQLSVGLTIAGLGGSALSVPLGMLVDRVGPRIVALIGVALMTLSFGLLGTATGSVTNWLVLWCFIAFANVWLQATVWTSAVASRFERSRGLAFAITLSGASFSAIVFPVLATWLIGQYGWRHAFMAMAGIWLVLVWPVLWLYFRSARDSRDKKAAVVAAAPAVLSGASVPEALRSFDFYKLLLASGLFTFTGIGIIVHFVPILTDRGADPLAAAGIVSLVGVFSFIGRLGTGFLLDRMPAQLVGAAVFLLPIIAGALLLFDGANPFSQAVAAASFGFTVGAEVDVIAYLVSRRFGLKNFGLFVGAMTGALTLGTAFGPLAAGMAYDTWNGYGEFLVLTMIFMAISSLAVATVRLDGGVAGAAARAEEAA